MVVVANEWNIASRLEKYRFRRYFSNPTIQTWTSGDKNCVFMETQALAGRSRCIAEHCAGRTGETCMPGPSPAATVRDVQPAPASKQSRISAPHNRRFGLESRLDT